MRKQKIFEDNTELRSKNVRTFLEEEPPSLVRLGVYIILFLFVLLVVAAYFLPYPYGHGETIIIHLMASLEVLV
jgi:hypothetical protein